MKSKEYSRTRSCVYNIHYHIIWCVKYRRKVLTQEVATFLCELPVQIGERNGFTVSSAQVGEGDHVHVFVDAQPGISIPQIVKSLKGTSAVMVFREFPWIRQYLWGGHLWSGSYFVETVGSTSEENVKRYIENQKNY